MSSADRLHLPPVAVPVESKSAVRARARFRSRLVGLALFTALSTIAARGAQLCLAPSERVVQAGSMQRYAPVVLQARRGQIYDRNGRRLAISVDTPSVAVDPFLLKDAKPEDVDALAADVARILDVPKDEILEKLHRDGRYVKLAARVHPAVAAQIDALKSPALWTYEDPHRYYPEETLASQVVGFVDASGAGQGGLEQALDRDLHGGSVVVQRRRDRKGLDVDRPAMVDLGANDGLDVHTTIDRQIQHFAEGALDEIVKTSAPVATYALVVDVKTGDVLALANRPTYNPNDVGGLADGRKDHIVVDAIEPGSVFKPFTMSAAIEEKLVTPETKIDCEGGFWAIGRSRIRDDHKHGVVTVAEVLKYSSNIGSAKLAFKVGATKFVDYLHRFGFGEKTGIPLPGERQGRIRDPETIKPIELATTAFGQGVTATPLQLVMGIATIANGGVRMAPRLVSEVVDQHGVPEWVQRPTAVTRVISEETAREVAQMMEGVTEDGGTGTRARVPGFEVAGKTGTAQKVKDGRYSDARIGSFVGFIPADHPVLAIAVVVDEPTVGSKYGGTVAAPAFASIAEQSLRYLGVEPDPQLLAEDAPKSKKKDDDDAVADAGKDTGDADAPLALSWTGDGWEMPDVSGRSMRDVLVALQGAGLHLDVQGSGVAVAQKPAAGERIPVGGTVSVVFR